MVVKGVIRGKVIELDQLLPFADGETVSVEVSPVSAGSSSDAQRLLQVLRGLQRTDEETIHEFERIIEEGRQAARYQSPFDE